MGVEAAVTPNMAPQIAPLSGGIPVAEIAPTLPFSHPETSFLPHIHFDVTHPFPITEKGEDLGSFARDLLQNTGMPLRRVKELAYVPNKFGNHGVVGSWESGGLHDGRLSFYKDMKEIPAIGQVGVAVHEAAHASSPFEKETWLDFGSEENRQRSLHNVIAVAAQAETTGIFLNGYHEFIYRQKNNVQSEEEYRSWQQMYLEETHAIASELAATHYNHLANVEEQQFAKLKEMGLERDFISLTSRQDTNGQIHTSGIDQTLIDLMGLEHAPDLHKHWRSLRARYGGTKTPFHDVPDSPIEFLPFIPGTEIIILGVYRPTRRNPWELSLLTPAEQLEEESTGRRTHAA